MGAMETAASRCSELGCDGEHRAVSCWIGIEKEERFYVGDADVRWAI